MNRPCTILIADDEPSGRHLLEALLQGRGYELAIATDGIEALALVQKLKPDLLLLDVMMPGMDGFEVCSHIRADATLEELPIVLLTTLDDRESRLSGLEAGADDFLTKPYDAVELLARVRTITRINRYARLNSERNKFSWVVQQADDAYVMVDSNDSITFANDRARSWLGLTEEGLRIGFLNTARLQYRTEPAEAWANWNNPAELDPAAARFLLLPESKAEHPAWLRVELLELTQGPQASRLIRLRNVTDQMRDRRDLWTLRSALCHKLRTPLNGLKGCLDLISDPDHGMSPGEIGEMAGLASESVRRLDQTVRGMLQFLDAPTSADTSPPFRLANLEELLQQQASELAIPKPLLSMARGLENRCLGMSSQAFELIMREFLQNAGKFHPANAPTTVVCVMPAGSSTVRISVLDDGVNLSPVQLARVWAPGYQIEKHFTGEVPGVGLGLPMVASLIWQSNGKCRLLNRENGQPGVVVEVELPLNPDANT
jgi:two-component system cell cycle response regulator